MHPAVCQCNCVNSQNRQLLQNQIQPTFQHQIPQQITRPFRPRFYDNNNLHNNIQRPQMTPRIQQEFLRKSNTHLSLKKNLIRNYNFTRRNFVVLLLFFLLYFITIYLLYSLFIFKIFIYYNNFYNIYLFITTIFNTQKSSLSIHLF